MKTTKIFRSGKGQAVRLSKDFRQKGKDAEVFRRGNEIVLRETDPSSKPQTDVADMSGAFELLASLPVDLTILDRRDDFPQRRKGR